MNLWLLGFTFFLGITLGLIISVPIVSHHYNNPDKQVVMLSCDNQEMTLNCVKQTYTLVNEEPL